MSEKADGGLLQLGQDTHNSPGKTSSEVNATARPFTVNQSSVVCLPLVSDSQRIIWVSCDGVGGRAEGEETRSEGANVETTHLGKKRKAKSGQRLAPVQPWPPRRSLEAPNDLLDASCQTRASPAPPVPCVHRGPLKTEAQTDLDLDGEGVALPGRVRLRARSQAQLEMMQAAFAQCQYPNVEDYSRLSEAIEVPRYALVQWFGDMRYYVKKFHPRWPSGEQYARALATIRDQQHLRSLEKVQPRGSCGEEQSRPVSPKEKTAPQPAGLMPL